MTAASGRSRFPAVCHRVTLVAAVITVCASCTPAASATGPKPVPPALTAAAELAALPVRDRDPVGYQRSLFGPAWTDIDQNGCDTRDDVLRRDLADVHLRRGSRCVVETGTLHDRYTGSTVLFQRGPGTSSAVQIDHVWPLHAAWAQGASEWSAAQRLVFANDELNLLATTGAINQAKGDRMPDTWLPPDRDYQCQYVARGIAVGVKYRLAVTITQRDAMARVLTSCPRQAVPS